MVDGLPHLLTLFAQAQPKGFNWDTFVKIVILLVLYPVWWPVLKALYNDFQGALWEEGGLFGREPSERELAELKDRYGGYRSPLRSETHEQYLDRVRSGRGFRAPLEDDYENSAPDWSQGGIGSSGGGPRPRSF